MQNEITILVNYNDNDYEFRVSKTDSIGKIFNLIGLDFTSQKTHKIIMGQSVLSPSLSFSLYDVQNLQKFQIIDTSRLQTFSKSLNSDYVKLFERMSSIRKFQHEYSKTNRKTNSKKLLNEASRLKDLFFRKVDGSYNSTKKLIHRFNQIVASTEENEQKNVSFESKMTVFDDNATSPSTEMLPTFWE